MTPTRQTIEAPVTVIAKRIRFYNGSWVTLTELIDFTFNIEGNASANGLSFGDASFVTGNITVRDTTNLPANWKNLRVWFDIKFQQGDWVEACYGFIKGRTKGDKEWSLSVYGIMERIKDYKIYTKVNYRRPIATRTAIAIDDNPDNVNYAGGLINEIFWRAGGRPDSQRGTYTNADFYYTCDQSIIVPEWLWLSGENLEEELYSLARAGGGQIYQGADDVIRYVQPLAFAGTSSYTITDRYFSTATQSEESAADVGTLRGVYTPRLLRANQSVYVDTAPKLIPPSGIITIEAKTQLPIYSYVDLTSRKVIKAHAWDHIQEFPIMTVSGFSAQRIVFTLQNTLSGIRYGTEIVTRVELIGRPVAATEKGYVSYGTSNPEKTLEDNPYVQSRQHSQMLARMTYDFYAPNKPIITLAGCGYDPDRYIGETVTLNSQYYTLSGVHRIIGLSYSDLEMQLKLVNVVGVLSRADIFLIGTTYTSETRRLSY